MQKTSIHVSQIVILVAVLGIGRVAATEPSAELFLPQAVSGTSIWSTPRAKISKHLVPQGNITYHFAKDPVRISSRKDGKLVARLLYNQSKFDIAVGIGFFNYVQVGFTLPLIAHQAGDTIEKGKVVPDKKIQSVGIGDMRAELTGRFFRFSGFGMGAQILAFLPTPEQKFQANESFRVRPRLIFDYELNTKIPLVIAATIGWQIEPKSTSKWLEVDDSLTWSAGVEVGVWPKYLHILANAYGSWEALAKKELSEKPVSGEVLAGVRAFFGNTGLSATAGGGVGFAPGFGTSSFRMVASLAYSPQTDSPIGFSSENVELLPKLSAYTEETESEESPSSATGTTPKNDAPCKGAQCTTSCADDPLKCKATMRKDADQDGIPDAVDGCPNDPEDIDSFEDEDGCPDPDNDGDGILDFDDSCPLKPGIPELNGCPFLDKDKDGIVDADDACAEEPEDIDGFEDQDGCPDPDNDNDGVDDKDDKCPNEPETINGVDDNDGCPDVGESAVRVENDRIQILERVFFDTGRATIKNRSFNVLNQVASILKAHREIKVLRVEGHTDSTGNDMANLKLSQQRAASVKEYLMKQGIAPERLSSRGYGESHPVDTNKTQSGRANNRRVEFHIIERKKK